MTLTIIVVSIIVQTLAVALAAQLAARTRQASWLFWTFAALLMLVTRVLNLTDWYVFGIPLKANDESLALLIAVSVAAGLLCILRGPAGQSSDRSTLSSDASPQRTQRPALAALVLGIVAVIGSFVVELRAFQVSRAHMVDTVSSAHLNLARAIKAYYEQTSISEPVQQALTDVRRMWNQTKWQYPNSYFRVLDADGRLLADSHGVGQIGAHDLGATVAPSGADAAAHWRMLVRNQEDWIGTILHPDGRADLVAVAFVPSRKWLVAIHMPLDAVEATVHTSIAPWVEFSVFVVVLILPLALGSLQWANVRANRALEMSRQAQTRLERRYYELIENANDIVYSHDLSGRLLTMNRAGAALLGYEPEELIGRPIDTLVSRHQRDAFNRMLSETLHEHGAARLEVEAIAKDGRRISLELSTRLFLEDDKPTAFQAIARDISDRKRAEQGRREIEERLQLVFEEMPVVFWTTDAQLRFTSSLGGGLKRLGLVRNQIVGMTVAEYFGERNDDAPVVVAHRVALQGISSDLSVDFAGNIYHTHIETMRDGDKQIVGCIGIALDVTEQKQAERELRESEERFRAFMDNSPLVAIIKDESGRYVYGNRSWAQQFAHELDELIGKDDATLWGEETARQFRVSDDAVLTDWRSSEFVQHMLDRDGMEHWWSSHKFPLRNEAGQRLVGILSLDITEKRRAQLALRRSQESLERAQQLAGLGSWESDPKSETETWSKQLYAIFGRDPDLGPPSFGDFLDLVHPEDRRKLIDAEQVALRTEESLSIEFRTNPSIGPKRELVCTLSAIDRPDGGRILAGTVLDVTERRMLEEQLRQSQKMDAIGQLAGGIAHDFNNLLTAIIGYGDLLLDELEHADPRRATMEGILSAAERAASLTRQLLAFSRRQMLQASVLNLNDVLTDMEKMLRRVIGEDVELVGVPEPNLGMVRADRSQIEQVVLNLAVNARDAMPGGGRLTIESANVELDASYTLQHPGSKPGPHVMLAVSDTGTGMNAETLKHIFEPFFTTKDLGKGTGLGLSTVYGILKQSDGSIQVYSEPGRGTTFKIYLPRVDDNKPTSTAEHARALARGSETILVVEDEPAVLQLAGRVLRQSGYSVLEAQGAAEAIEAFEQNDQPINLLLTDVVMPQGSGRDVAESLKRSLPDLRVVYMSGYTDDTVLRHGILEAGAAFLQKPFTPQSLTRLVRDVLDR